MSDWTAGYVADIDYTYGYYNELNPNRATLAFLNAGYVPPSQGVHCELGFGQGLSVNVHAAASGLTWYANDFNPSQAAFAQSLAAESGADAYLTDEAFADFCSRTDLPDFDSIGLHGIWSWISDENRSIIVDFIRRKLKVGGGLYVSYNTLPGWATFAPVRHLLTEHASVLGSTGKGVVSRIDGALEFAQKLLDTNPLYAKANPGVAERLKKVAGQDRHYLAHEYFNKDWHPMYFAAMSDWLSPAKVNFACSAHYLDHIDTINLSPEQQALLKEITDPTFKESVRDFMVFQQFRRDYWIKGPQKLSASEKIESINQHRLVLITNKKDISLQVTGALGVAKLNSEIYQPVLDLMSDHSIRSCEEIATAVKGVTFGQVLQVVMVLVGTGDMASVQSEQRINKTKTTVAALNMALLQKAKSDASTSYLASPVTGGGVIVNRFHQLFLLSIIQGTKPVDEIAQSAWDILSVQNELLMKDGKPLETAQENLNELTHRAQEFLAKNLPILKALLVI